LLSRICERGGGEIQGGLGDVDVHAIEFAGAVDFIRSIASLYSIRSTAALRLVRPIASLKLVRSIISLDSIRSIDLVNSIEPRRCVLARADGWRGRRGQLC